MLYTMDKPITTRLPEEFVKRIKELAKKENLDSSAVIRRLLARALEEEKLKMVLEKLSLHKVSINKAANMLDISLWEMIELIKKNNIDWTNYNEEELEREFSLIK